MPIYMKWVQYCQRNLRNRIGRAAESFLPPRRAAESFLPPPRAAKMVDFERYTLDTFYFSDPACTKPIYINYTHDCFRVEETAFANDYAAFLRPADCSPEKELEDCGTGFSCIYNIKPIKRGICVNVTGAQFNVRLNSYGESSATATSSCSLYKGLLVAMVGMAVLIGIL